MDKVIKHKGRVVLVDGDRIDVEMIVDSACTACKAKKACGMGEESTKVVSLLTRSARMYEEGEEVDVSIEQRMGIKAAAYAYMYPFVVIVAVLLIMFELGFSDLVSGLSALGAAALYYVVLSFFRHRIEKEIIFKLSKI